VESEPRTSVILACAIVSVFIVGGFAALVSPPPNNFSEDVEGSQTSSVLPAPVAHWDMSTIRNNKLQNLVDPSGATDGITLNTASSQNGIVGGSLDFNGNNSAIEIPDSNDLLKSDSGTVSAWIKSTGKPPETNRLKVALVIVETGLPATEQNISFLRRIGENATAMYGEMVHGHGSLDVDQTIYVQPAVNATVQFHHLVELNNFIRHGYPDVYDFIAFFTTTSNAWGSNTNMINFKNTMHGIGQPCLWYTSPGAFAVGNDTEPLSKFVTAATMMIGRIPVVDSSCDNQAAIMIHEMSHAWCAWWHYKIGETTYRCPVATNEILPCHYQATVRTDLHSALGGSGWLDLGDGNWTCNANFLPGLPRGNITDTGFNMDEYTIGLIPAAQVVPTHHLVPAINSWIYPPGSGAKYAKNDSQITIDQVLAAEGPRWNEEDRQCVMLRCTNEYGNVFQGQGWGLFMGTVAPNDTICWWSGPANGSVWTNWKYGTAHVGDGAWHNIVVTWSGPNATLYVDGVKDIEWAINPVTAAAHVHTVIGCEEPTNPYFPSWFSGSIDEVYLFNTNLADAEVKQLYGFSDSFDDGTLSPWTATGSLVQVSNVLNHSAPYSLYVQYSVSQSTGTQRATSPAITTVGFTKPYSISFLYYRDFAGVSRTSPQMYVVEDGRISILDKTNNFYAVTSSGNVLISGSQAYAWYKFQINVDPATSSYRVSIGDVYVGTYGFLAQSSGNQIAVGSPVNPSGRIACSSYWDDFLVVGSPPQPPTPFTDNFDDGTLSPWTATGSLVQVSNVLSHSAPYSLYVQYSVSQLTGTQRATSPAITTVDFTKPYSISFWYYRDFAGVSRTSPQMYVVDDGRVSVLDKANNFYAVTSSGNVLISGSQAYAWYKFQITVNPATSSYQVFINDVNVGTYAFLAQSSSNHIAVGSPVNPSGKIACWCYWDDFVVSQSSP